MSSINYQSSSSHYAAADPQGKLSTAPVLSETSKIPHVTHSSDKNTEKEISQTSGISVNNMNPGKNSSVLYAQQDNSEYFQDKQYGLEENKESDSKIPIDTTAKKTGKDGTQISGISFNNMNSGKDSYVSHGQGNSEYFRETQYGLSETQKIIPQEIERPAVVKRPAILPTEIEKTDSELSGFGSINMGKDSYQQSDSNFFKEKQYGWGETKEDRPKPYGRPNASELTEAEQSEAEFSSKFDDEMDNLKEMLKMLYTEKGKGAIMECLSENEPVIGKFYRIYQAATDPIAVKLAGLYLALDEPTRANDELLRIEDPDETEDDEFNAGYHRAFFIMKANMKIKEGKFADARDRLDQCRNVAQSFFEDGQEDFLDFYATSMGKIYMKEENYEEAEKCFKDALALRLKAENPRLISSSYNDLAQLYIQKCKKSDDKERVVAKEYLDKAIEYDQKFVEGVKNNSYDLLIGQVDYKRLDLAETESLLKSLS